MTGFGKFCLMNKGKRRARNPQSGEDLMLPARRIVAFNCSTALRTKMNGGQVPLQIPSDFAGNPCAA
jgi:integration host factor subunit alpha